MAVLDCLARGLAKKRRLELRAMLRGYRRLRSEGRGASVAAVKRELTAQNLPLRGVSRLIFGAANTQAEQVVRQFLLVRQGAVNLTQAQLHSAGTGESVRHALPPVWRQVLRKHGFAVDGVASAVRLWCYAFAMLCAGVLHALRMLRPVAGAAHFPVHGPYACFDSLAAGNLPLVSGRASHDVMTWYASWEGRAPVTQLCHALADQSSRRAAALPASALPTLLPPVQGGRSKLRFAGWSLATSLLCIVDLLRGRWWHALLLKEAVTAAAVRLAPEGQLAADYLFHNSNWIYRPLWTYEAQARGSRILFYFYSTNCEAFQKEGRRSSLMFGWEAMTWPHFLVWDDWQAAFVRRAVGERARMDIVGPIPFQAGVDEPVSLPSRLVLAFDVQPMRDAHYQTLGLDFDYYIPSIAVTFLRDVLRAAQACGASMGLKRKREIGRALHPNYRQALDALSQNPSFLAIDPDTAAMQLIPQAAAVISMPFTSTAILAGLAGKPSAFYDPTGVCEPDDPAAHGITVLRGFSQLQSWLAKALSSDPAAARASPCRSTEE